MTLPRIVVVGSRAELTDVCNNLESAGRYRMYYVPAGSAGLRFDPKPDVVLLHLPGEQGAAEKFLASIESIKQEVPVVVISRAADMNLYLTAMSCGAFDYITSYTPPEEVARVLSTAVRWRLRRAA